MSSEPANFEISTAAITDFTGWLLPDAQNELVLTNPGGHELTLIETAPPRAAGPLGHWRVVRCEYAPVAPGSAPSCRFWVAQEQLPKVIVEKEIV